MCGIFGYAKLDPNAKGLNPFELRIAMSYLCLSNKDRGTDSVGMSQFEFNGMIRTMKKIGDSDDFLQDVRVKDTFKDIESMKDTKIIMGHTRAATTGEVNLENAMPFTYGNIIGTHNGMVYNYDVLAREAGLDMKTTCDSEIIFAMQCTVDSLKDRAYQLSLLNGYFATAFVNTEEKDKIYFAKDYGDLSLWYDSDRRYILWSSEDDGIKLLKTILDLDYLEEHQTNSYELLAINGKFEVEDIPIPYSSVSTKQDWLNSEDLGSKAYVNGQALQEIGRYTNPPTYASTSSKMMKVKCGKCEKRKNCRWDNGAGDFLCKKCRRRHREDYNKDWKKHWKMEHERRVCLKKDVVPRFLSELEEYDPEPDLIHQALI